MMDEITHQELKARLAASPVTDDHERLIRAELSGSKYCTAVGISARGYAPILKLCDMLIAVGVDPTRPMHAYRGDVLCLYVSTIGEAANLEVRPSSGSGGPIFVRRARPNRDAAS
jgi:hypothetical protein